MEGFGAMCVLAITDGWVIGMWAVNLGASVGLGVGMYLLNSRTRKIETLETRLDAAARDGKTLAEKLIDERLRAASHEVNNHVQGFVVALEMLKSQAAEAASEFKQLNEADHENELTVATQIGGLKVWISEHCASKDDLKSIDRDVRQLGEKVAVLASKGKVA